MPINSALLLADTLLPLESPSVCLTTLQTGWDIVLSNKSSTQNYVNIESQMHRKKRQEKYAKAGLPLVSGS